jgi:hypothetical protein
MECDLQLLTEGAESAAGEKTGQEREEYGLRPGYGGQQHKTEKSFISRTLAKRPLPETLS